MGKLIILCSIGLFVLVCTYYFLVKPALKLRNLNKKQEEQEIKKSKRRKPWKKTVIPPKTYAYRKK